MYRQILKTLCVLVSFIYIGIYTTEAQNIKKKPAFNSAKQLPANIQINSSSNTLFAYYDNEINIVIPAPVNIYEIEVSQGLIRNINDAATNISGVNNISNLKPGNITITIYRNKNGQRQVANQRTFDVKEKVLPQYPGHITQYLDPHPVISLAGFDSVITLSALRRATKLEINKPYKILKYTLEFRVDELQVFQSTTKFFSTDLIKALNKCNYYKPLYIRDILIEDAEGFIYMYPIIIFKVINDKGK